MIKYTINNFTGAAKICQGESYELKIDPDSEDPIIDSPLKFASLTYNWYKDSSASPAPILLVGASGYSYIVNVPGVYYFETNFGTCTSESYSNRVAISYVDDKTSVTIDSSLGNPFCSDADGTLLTAGIGNSYLWTKDGKELSKTRSINVKESGIYTVEVDFGGCKNSGTINLETKSFSASIDTADQTFLKYGENLNVSVTSDAKNPSFEWFENDNIIAGENSNFYLVTRPGMYKVIISQTEDCISSKEFSFRINGESKPSSVIPNIIKLSSLNPYWNIPSEFKNEDTKVVILNSNREKVLDVVNYQGDWPQSLGIEFKNINPVYYYIIVSSTGERRGSITIIK